MARDSSQAWEDAIRNTAGVKTTVRADVYNTRTFFSSIGTNNAWTQGVEGIGLINSPTKQYPSWNPVSDTVITFWNFSGTLRYNKPDNAAYVNTVYSNVFGIPSVYGNYLFVNINNRLWRYTINWNLINSRSTDPLSDPVDFLALPSNTHCVYGISESICISIHSYNGRLRPNLKTYPTLGIQYDITDTSGFAFPMFIDYADGGTTRTMDSLAAFSGALLLGSTAFVYASDPYTGSVVGKSINLGSYIWSDIFTAVPTNIKESFCEFRATNAYTRNGTGYLVGQFFRSEYAGATPDPYTMILSSTDGRNFSIDRFTLVSDIGYRFLGVCGSNKLFLANCNRICSASIPITFDGATGTAASKVSIPETSIRQFKDTSLNNASLELKAGDEALMFDALIQEENLVKVYVGYVTNGGTEDKLYGTYIIQKVNRGFRDGKRTLVLTMLNETAWKLNNLASPYYSEIFSKSSVFVDLTEEESGELYVADSVRYVKDSFSIDFWSSEPHVPEQGSGTTGINVLKDGGVTYYDATGAPHDLSVRTKSIKDVLGLAQNPIITNTTVTANLYGWSNCAPEGAGDRVELILVTRDPETGVETNRYSTGFLRWPNSRATSPSGSEPVAASITGLTVGHEIVKVGMQIINSIATWFCVERVDVTSGVRTYITPDDGNTPWIFEEGVGVRVPGKGRPYIMFSQKPFDAYNFQISATFKDTATAPNTSYRVGAGLVGLAENGLNYIVGRFNKSPDASGRLEIAKVRDGVETVLATAVPNFTADPDYKLLFQHENGIFTLWEYDYAEEEWVIGTQYTWTTTDGWIYTSTSTVKKCGIYASRDAPKFRIPGFYINADQEDQSPSDGIPMLPGESYANFPSSGEVEIGDSVYTYTSKTTAASLPRGPYQFKRSSAYDAGHGLEMGYFNWGLGMYTYGDKLLASDSGYTYDIDSSLFQVQDDDENYLYDRSRHYSANSTISKAAFSQSNRIYFLDGLLGITLVSGEQEKHSIGSLCMQRSTGEIYCTQFAGSSGDADVTVENLIDKIVRLSGGKANFPGDIVIAEQTVNGDYMIDSVPLGEGIDLRFVATSATTVAIKFNMVPAIVDGEHIILEVEPQGSDIYEIRLIDVDASTVIECKQIYLVTYMNYYRVVVHDSFITLYLDERWIHTFAFKTINYTTAATVYLSGSFTPQLIRMYELSDWREAIYIDLETNGTSALGNIIQERPVEQTFQPDGSISYSYLPERDSVLMLFEPREHQWSEEPPNEAASDAIVYSADRVKSLQYNDFASNYGFSTKVYRFPNLKIGAFRAAKILMERFLEQSTTHNLTMRPDARILPGDIYQISYTASGTGTVIDTAIIVELVDLRIMAGNSPTMIVQGRETTNVFVEWVIESITLQVS